MKNLLKLLSISALSISAFAGEDPVGKRNPSGTISDVENAKATVGGVVYDSVTLQNHGLYLVSAVTFSDTDTPLYLKSSTADDISVDTGVSSTVLVKASTTISQNVTIENTLADAALMFGWKGTLAITAGYTVDLIGAQTTTDSTTVGGGNLIFLNKSAISFTNRGTLNVGGYLKLLESGQGGVLTNYGILNVTDYTDIAGSVSRTVNLMSGSTSTFGGELTMSGGTLNINSGASSSFADTVTISGGTVNIGASGLNFEKNLMLQGGVINLTSGSDFTTYSSDPKNAMYNRIYVTAPTTVNVLDDDVLADKEFYIASSNLTVGFTTGTETVANNTDVTIETVYLNDSSSILTLDMSSLADSTGVTISIEDIVANENFATIEVDAFLNDILQIKELADSFYDILGSVTEGVASTQITVDGKMVNLKADVGDDIDDGYFAFNNNGALSFVVVPEPSTYAMIFGVIALAFAVYRRRK